MGADRRRAQALLEFALVVPLIMLCVIATADIALLVRDHSAMQRAVREAVRASVDRVTYADAASVADRTFTAAIQSARLEPARARSEPLRLEGRWGRGGTVELRASYEAPVPFPLPFLPSTVTMQHAERAAVITFVEHREGTGR